MDEVENPDLPAAGESSPTLRPMDEDDESAIEDGSPPKNILAPGGAEDILASTNRRTPLSPRRLQLPARPPLKREGSAPPQQPPPAPPEIPDSPQDQPDSLTLADLKRIRNLPGAQPPLKQQLLDCDSVYDFQYSDAQSLPVELEEWFTYSAEEQSKLKRCEKAFETEWRDKEQYETNWLDVTEESRRFFVTNRVKLLTSENLEEEELQKELMILTYICLGVWHDTGNQAGECKLQDLFIEDNGAHSRLDFYTTSTLQLRWIIAMVDTIHACNGLRVVYDTLRRILDQELKTNPAERPFRSEPLSRRPDESMQLWCCLTLMYVFIEVARTSGGELGQKLKDDIIALEPNLLHYLTQTVARLRWDDGAPVPVTKMLLLSWKSILVMIGGFKAVDNVKAFVRQQDEHEQSDVDAAGQPIITASPLDYHLFRQEISSKYPAYQAPPPLFPLEPENNSILPPLKHRRPSFAFSDTAYVGAPSVETESIMHQPIHIATPAPSPPPSPGGPGKAGKKQNYQTNQMFPFLYPPLDLSSNNLGGKGETQLQDALVGRTWDGSDIPASILEAAELFAKRMRATRAMKQLWEVRVDYMKYERGWKSSNETYDAVDDFELLGEAQPEHTAPQGEPLLVTEERRQLNAVAELYEKSLPHLQSVVIVLLKSLLTNVTDIVSRGNGQYGLQPGIQFNEPNGVNGTSAHKPLENGVGTEGEGTINTFEELDKLRTQEIASKAISGIIILLLKWFRVSHVLQYEYFTQLLLDSNYVPLVLKLWQTLDIGRACHFRLEREEMNFFYFCCENSRHGVPKAKEVDTSNAIEDSDEDALPPPIKLKRADPDNLLSPNTSPPDFSHPPEVDELGYPTTPLALSPIVSYSWRNIFSSVNYLRALQKITRRKTHRALLLVSYKSSNHLKKSLKVPIRLLRYYTLKLYKSQVPFCGRKWRQGNMKIITAVWLSVPAELRDDWLSGGGGGMGGACVGDVDGTVEDALPLEQSLRALTHWWNVKNYQQAMGVDKALLEEEMDFFLRELEKIEGGREMEIEGLVEEERLVDDVGAPWPGQGPIEGY